MNPSQVNAGKRPVEVESFMDTLAATHAEVGDFDEACRWANESLLPAPEGQRSTCKELLRMYMSGQPYRETGTMT